jgi:transcription elongation factor Elf1
MSRRSRHPGLRLLASTDFSCPGCGSPAVSLPRDLSAQGLVVCDRCGRPVATLAAFRGYVDRLAAGPEFCDHHLTVCHSDAAEPSSSTG